MFDNIGKGFWHNCGLRNDVRVSSLRRNFGNDGYAVYCYLMEMISASPLNVVDIYGIGEKTGELFAEDFGIDLQRFNDIVNKCAQCGLFDISNGYIYISASDLISEDDNKEDKRIESIDSKEPVEEEDNPVNISCDTKTYPYEAVVELWNNICSNLSKVIRLSKHRKDKLRKRLDEWCDGDDDKMLSAASDLFHKIASTPFLNGDNKENWCASFDWIIESPNNWIKVMEGRYDKNKPQKAVSNLNLGLGEFISDDGIRTYGNGTITIPNDAPPRPSASYQWSAETNSWIMI